MKRIITGMLVAAVVLALLTGCGGGEKDRISDKVYELGCAALDTTDDYIAGRITADDALKKLNYADSLIDSQIEKEKEENNTDSLYDTPYSGDGMVSLYLTSIKLDIGAKDRGTGTMADVKDSRNDLAKILGKK